MYQKTSNGDKNLTTASTEWSKECFEDKPVQNSSNKMWWLGALLLLVILAVVAWFLYNKKNQS